MLNDKMVMTCDICDKRIINQTHIVVSCLGSIMGGNTDGDICSSCFKKMPYPIQKKLCEVERADYKFNRTVIDAFKNRNSSDSLKNHYVVVYDSPPEIKKYCSKDRLCLDLLDAMNKKRFIRIVVSDDYEVENKDVEAMINKFYKKEELTIY